MQIVSSLLLFDRLDYAAKISLICRICKLFSLFNHHFLPFEIPCNGNNDVQGIERSLEGDVLVEVKYAGDDVDGYPDEPLLEILTGQGP